jgi:hypothetical protein
LFSNVAVADVTELKEGYLSGIAGSFVFDDPLIPVLRHVRDHILSIHRE